MERTFTLTRKQLVEAFTRWHADCPKDADGRLAGRAPDDPEGQADVLIGYLGPAA